MTGGGRLRGRIERDGSGDQERGAGDPQQNTAGNRPWPQCDREAEEGKADHEDRGSDGRGGRKSWFGEPADRPPDGIVSGRHQACNQHRGRRQNRRADTQDTDEAPHRATIGRASRLRAWTKPK